MAESILENSALIVPISNQADLAKRLCRNLEQLQTLLPVSKIIFAADRCNDTTEDLLRTATAGNSYFSVLPYSGGATGQAAAIVRAISLSKDCSILAFCDLDHLLEPQELARFLRFYSIKSDALRGIRMSRPASLFRRLASSLANRIASLCDCCDIADIGSPLLVTRREIIDQGLNVYQEHGPLYLPLIYPLIAERIDHVPVNFCEAFPSSYSISKLSIVALLFIQTAIRLKSIRRALIKQQLTASSL